MTSDPSNPLPKPADSWASHAKKALDISADAKHAGTETPEHFAREAKEAETEHINQVIKAAQQAREKAVQETRQVAESTINALKGFGNCLEAATDAAASEAGAGPSDRALAARDELERELRGMQEAQSAPVAEFFNQGKDPELIRAEMEKAMLEGRDPESVL